MLRIELQQTDSTDSKASNAECSGFNSGDFKALADPGKQLSSGNNEPPEFTAEVEPTVRPPTDVKHPSDKEDDLVLFDH